MKLLLMLILLGAITSCTIKCDDKPMSFQECNDALLASYMGNGTLPKECYRYYIPAKGKK